MSAAPLSCTIINIGQPGNISISGQYAGQVEQQYDNCHNVRAHWQWSSSYRTYHGSSQIIVFAEGWNGTVGVDPNSPWRPASVAQDYYSPWTYIYANGENTWRGRAEVSADNGAYCVAWGDWHRYSDGAQFGSVRNC
ncbi:hypothetical protein [Kitasatospora sp. NPDC059571]|uniref:hypothetical protein n=1 Tax=Kitasatospora sp. NPDC059571 TaxID=3346871 RepID=UPI00369512CB